MMDIGIGLGTWSRHFGLGILVHGFGFGVGSWELGAGIGIGVGVGAEAWVRVRRLERSLPGDGVWAASALRGREGEGVVVYGRSMTTTLDGGCERNGESWCWASGWKLWKLGRNTFGLY